MTARRGTYARLLLAVLVGVVTALYRFNTLGGTFGGFDNDHFVPFAYAKQVQAGERVLQEFDGLGLQGAWPSLTYELSALAQAQLGDNLRSESLLTVTAVGLAAATTLLATSLLAPTGWALAATVMSALVAPTLYNYPKVLALSIATLLIALYARRPSRTLVVCGAVLTAGAFLFRHDLAVYLAVGLLLGYATTVDRKRAAGDALIYGGLTLALLTPSLWYVQRHEGLVQYVQDGLDLSRREARRTDLEQWPHFQRPTAPGVIAFFDVEQNGVAWLHYLARVLPWLVALTAWRGGRDRPTVHGVAAHGAAVRGAAVQGAVMAIAGMAIVAVPLLVRGNVAVRLGDVGPLLAVVVAVACDGLAGRARQRVGIGRALRLALLVPLLVGTALSVRTVGVVPSQLGVSRLLRGPERVRVRTADVWRELGVLPGAFLTRPTDSPPLLVAQYLNQCTQPSDRVIGMTYEPELMPLAGRLFGGGRLSIIPDYALHEHQQRRVVDRWRRQRVPLVLVEFEEFYDPSSSVAPLVRDYLLAHYRAAGRIGLGPNRSLRVFVARDRPVVSRRGDGLPCLR